MDRWTDGKTDRQADRDLRNYSMIDNVPKQCAELLCTYILYNGENEVDPDSSHVPYIIIYCQ